MALRCWRCRSRTGTASRGASSTTARRCRWRFLTCGLFVRAHPRRRATARRWAALSACCWCWCCSSTCRRSRSSARAAVAAGGDRPSRPGVGWWRARRPALVSASSRRCCCSWSGWCCASGEPAEVAAGRAVEGVGADALGAEPRVEDVRAEPGRAVADAGQHAPRRLGPERALAGGGGGARRGGARGPGRAGPAGARDVPLAGRDAGAGRRGAGALLRSALRYPRVHVLPEHALRAPRGGGAGGVLARGARLAAAVPPLGGGGGGGLVRADAGPRLRALRRRGAPAPRAGRAGRGPGRG